MVQVVAEEELSVLHQERLLAKAKAALAARMPAAEETSRGLLWKVTVLS